MRKFLFLVLAGLMLTILSACGEGKEESGSGEVKAEEDSSQESIEVDKGLLNVEITLPASMFEGQDIDAVISEAENDGVTNVKVNDDGSLTYTMSKAKHKEMVEEFKNSILEIVEDTISDENLASIKDVTYNKTFSEFTLIVNQEEYESSLDGFAALGLGISGMYYHLVNGGKQEDNKVTILLKNESTEEVFNTIVYPDDLNQ